MESNKRKTETELEQEETKKVKLSEKEKKEMDLEEWIRGCESLNPQILFENEIRDIGETENEATFYKDLPDTLEKDKALFADICPLPFAHEIAKHWILPFGKLDYSSEQRILFFVLDNYIKKNDEKRRSLLLIRLMEIAKYYENEDNTKYKLQGSLISVPEFAETILAVMDHSNLRLIQPNTSPFGAFRNQSLTDKYGFDTIVQQSLFPKRKIVTDPTLFLSTDYAKNKSTKRYNALLLERYESPEFLNAYLKPLVLKITERKCDSDDKVIYIVNDSSI